VANYYNAYGYTIKTDSELLLHKVSTEQYDYLIECKKLSESVNDFEQIVVESTDSHMKFKFPRYGAANVYKKIINAYERPGLNIFERTELVINSIILMLHILKGDLVVHGATVLINGKAYCIAGPSLSGKSTLSAALLKRGYPVFADEFSIIAVSRETQKIMALPGKAWISINRDVVPFFEDDLTFIGTHEGKYCVKIPECQSAECSAIVFFRKPDYERDEQRVKLEVLADLLENLRLPGHQGALAPELFLRNLCHIIKNVKTIDFCRQDSLSAIDEDVSSFLKCISLLEREAAEDTN